MRTTENDPKVCLRPQFLRSEVRLSETNGNDTIFIYFFFCRRQPLYFIRRENDFKGFCVLRSPSFIPVGLLRAVVARKKAVSGR